MAAGTDGSARSADSSDGGVRAHPRQPDAAPRRHQRGPRIGADVQHRRRREVHQRDAGWNTQEAQCPLKALPRRSRTENSATEITGLEVVFRVYPFFRRVLRGSVFYVLPRRTTSTASIEPRRAGEPWGRDLSTPVRSTPNDLAARRRLRAAEPRRARGRENRDGHQRPYPHDPIVWQG